jgi:RNA polymerase sigma-70 factor (ECF subfamily)
MSNQQQARGGDVAAFSTVIDAKLVNEWHPLMMRMALRFVSTPDVAEEIVQETWLAVLQGLATFRGCSSFRTWVLAILIKRAQTYVKRAQRTITFSDCAFAEQDEDEVNLRPGHWQTDEGHGCNRWLCCSQDWRSPEEQSLQEEVASQIQQGIASLPVKQRNTMLLRDVEGWSSEEICLELGLSEVNQRVLLHRARAHVRRVLERYLHS